MKKASKLLLLLGILLALLGGGALFLYLQALGTASAQAPAQTNIVVAAADIPSYRPITAEMLKLQPVPAASVTADHVQSLSAATGKALSAPATAGQQILAGTLTDAAFSYSIPKDAQGKPLKAVAVFVDRLSAMNGLLTNGDHVDVMYTGTLPQVNITEKKNGQYADPKETGPTGKIVAQYVQVIKVVPPAESVTQGNLIVPETLQARQGSAGAEGEGGAEGETAFWTVMLAVTNQQAEYVRYAQMNGVVSLVLRANGDDAIEKTTGVSEEILNNEQDVPLPVQPER